MIIESQTNEEVANLRARQKTQELEEEMVNISEPISNIEETVTDIADGLSILSESGVEVDTSNLEKKQNMDLGNLLSHNRGTQ